MAKRKNPSDTTFNPVTFNVDNIRRLIDGGGAPEEAGPAEALEAAAAAEAGPAEAAPPETTAEIAAVEPPPPAASPVSPAPRRPTRTPAKKRRPPASAKKGKGFAAAAEARQNRELYKTDYLRVFVDARQRRDLGRFVMDLSDALDVRLPETIVYRAVLSLMQSAREEILAAAEAGEPLPATPARQDPVQMAEAEYRVAQLLRAGILAAAEAELDAQYVGKLDVEDEDAAAAA